MINNNYGMFSGSPSSCDNDAMIVQRVADFLGPRDIGRCECVCKLFKTFYNDQGIWIGLFSREGIPFVEGKDRDRRADFQVLYPMTISGAKISRFLGEVVGKIPNISEVIFSVLNAPDPFEEGKLMKDTFVFVVVPSLIKGFAGAHTPLDLDGEGNLIEVSADKVQNGKELVIPFSERNLKMLCSHPLEGKENMPVFSQYCTDKVINECGGSDKVSVWFQRKCVAEESRNLPYAKQEALVGGFDITRLPLRSHGGFDVTSLLVRSLYDAILILESGTCPDSKEPRWTYARCSDTVHYGNDEYHAAIGGFAPRSGADVNDVGCDDGFVGVAPGVPAEVLRPLELGSSLVLG